MKTIIPRDQLYDYLQPEKRKRLQFQGFLLKKMDTSLKQIKVCIDANQISNVEYGSPIDTIMLKNGITYYSANRAETDRLITIWSDCLYDTQNEKMVMSQN